MIKKELLKKYGEWRRLTDRERDVIKNIPNFNKDKFKQITGIEI